MSTFKRWVSFLLDAIGYGVAWIIAIVMLVNAVQALGTIWSIRSPTNTYGYTTILAYLTHIFASGLISLLFTIGIRQNEKQREERDDPEQEIMLNPPLRSYFPGALIAVLVPTLSISLITSITAHMSVPQVIENAKAMFIYCAAFSIPTIVVFWLNSLKARGRGRGLRTMEYAGLLLLFAMLAGLPGASFFGPNLLWPSIALGMGVYSTPFMYWVLFNKRDKIVTLPHILKP